MQPIPVDDLEDPRLEPYRMVREKDLAGRKGVFIAEGRVVLDSLLAHGRHPMESVLVSAKRLPQLLDLLARVPDEVPIYTLPHEAVYELVGFPIHRGLLAAGRRVPLPSPQELLASLPAGRATVLVLEGLTNHDNTGACFRNAAAFGVDALLLDDRCCDPLYRKSIRVSAGHALALPYSRSGSIEEVLGALKQAGFVTAGLCLSDRAQPLDRCMRPAERLAVLLGTEGPGLTQAALDAADLHLRIPMAPDVDSLNVATAGAVALFGLTQGGSGAD